MKILFRACALCVASNMNLVAFASPDPSALSRPSYDNIGAELSALHVVEARVTGIKNLADEPDAGGTSRLTLVVTRVFSGSSIRTGDGFVALAAAPDAPALSWNRTMQLVSPVPKVGEVGIWQLYPTHDGPGFRGNRDDGGASPPFAVGGRNPLPFLGNESGLEKPDAVSSRPKVAAALQSIAEGNTEGDRVKRVAELLRERDPYVSLCACSLLANALVEGRELLAREAFKDEKVSFGAKLALDQLLCHWSREEWTQDNARIKIFEKQLSSNATRDDFEAIADRLATGTAASEFSIPQCIQLTRGALANDGFIHAYGDKLWKFMLFATQARSAPERDELFAFFKEMLTSALDHSRLHAAAYGLLECSRGEITLASEQLQSIRSLVTQTDDSYVRQTLELIVEEATKKPPARTN